MRRTLKELYLGNVASETKAFARNTEYARAMDVVSGTEEKLLELLDDTGKQLFEKNVDAQGKLLSITGLESFVEGFRLGSRLAVEVFADDDGDLKDIIDV